MLPHLKPQPMEIFQGEVFGHHSFQEEGMGNGLAKPGEVGKVCADPSLASLSFNVGLDIVCKSMFEPSVTG
jgi:hypothetical protein